ncbi:unnamed protein product [Pylaiella littoralis]
MGGGGGGLSFPRAETARHKVVLCSQHARFESLDQVRTGPSRHQSTSCHCRLMSQLKLRWSASWAGVNRGVKSGAVTTLGRPIHTCCFRPCLLIPCSCFLSYMTLWSLLS